MIISSYICLVRVLCIYEKGIMDVYRCKCTQDRSVIFFYTCFYLSLCPLLYMQPPKPALQKHKHCSLTDRERKRGRVRISLHLVPFRAIHLFFLSLRTQDFLCLPPFATTSNHLYYCSHPQTHSYTSSCIEGNKGPWDPSRFKTVTTCNKDTNDTSVSTWPNGCM